MRSQAATDFRHGLIASLTLVVVMLWVVHVINRHAEEHGHCAPLAMLDVVVPERGEGDGKRVGVHARIVGQPTAEKHVRGGCP